MSELSGSKLFEDGAANNALTYLSRLPIFSIIAIVSIPLYFFFRAPKRSSSEQNYDVDLTDPSLLKKHSEFRSYHVPATGFTYPSIRIFFRHHLQADKLPSRPLPLPLLVFIHGLGGSAAQFGPLLTSLVNIAPCLCIDLPGCGRSKFAPTDWDAYTTQALTKLVAVIVDSYRDKENSQKVIFIGHSMGSSISALLASNLTTDIGNLPSACVGLVALCPRANPATPKQSATIRRMLYLPGFALNMLRYFDKRGGVESSSVKRMVGDDADFETKKLQLRYNQQSKTDVFRRMAYGILAQFQDGSQIDGLPGEQVWSSLDLPVFLIAGESDRVTNPEEAEKISAYIQAAWKENPRKTDTGTIKFHEVADTDSFQPSLSHLRPPRALKTSVIPAPAAHALFFAPATCRTISGLIQSFFSDHVDGRLSVGWQLEHLSTEGKWDVKNLVKWQGVVPISEPIAGTFRAMKTMREVDDSHCPKEFARKWAGEIKAVIDISHESPVYDPNNLERGGIEYHKFPTVSKHPPTEEEAKHFIELVDQLKTDGDKSVIAVHCHYGYNRTGYFIICYLVDRMGWRLQDAVEEFAKRRPPGIRHDYFIDTLFARYSVGMKNSPTI